MLSKSILVSEYPSLEVATYFIDNSFVTLIKTITPNQAHWPKLSVWTGENDGIVNPLNATMLAEQWALLLKATAKPKIDNKLGYSITRWNNMGTDVQVELIEVKDRDHGIMVNPNVEHGGEVSDYVLAAPLSTAKYVVEFWGL